MTDDVAIAAVPYSLRQVVREAGMSGPRWKLHLIKLAQHAAPAFALLCLTQLRYAVAIAALCGPIAYAGILVRKLYRAWQYVPRGWMHDYLRAKCADWIFDASFALVTLAGGFVASGDRIGGGLLLGACIALYVALHTQGDP